MTVIEKVKKVESLGYRVVQDVNSGKIFVIGRTRTIYNSVNEMYKKILS